MSYDSTPMLKNREERCKVEALKLVYHKTKDNNCKSGRDMIVCPFHDNLDKVCNWWSVNRPTCS